MYLLLARWLQGDNKNKPHEKHEVEMYDDGDWRPKTWFEWNMKQLFWSFSTSCLEEQQRHRLRCFIFTQHIKVKCNFET